MIESSSAIPATDRSTPADAEGEGFSSHPLGPLLRRRRSARPGRARLIAAGVLSGSLVALAIAATLQPSDSGMGTHRQLGYPSCLWPVLTGYPCPTCGMTTAFAFAVRGRFGSALLAQPAGLVAAIATMLAAVLSVDVIVTGRAWSVNGYRLRPDRVAMGVLAVVAAGWAFKLVVVWWARSWSGGP